jgi:hypothetical protein
LSKKSCGSDEVGVTDVPAELVEVTAAGPTVGPLGVVETFGSSTGNVGNETVDVTFGVVVVISVVG